MVVKIKNASIYLAFFRGEYEKNKMLVLDKLRKLKEIGKTVIIVTHDLNIAKSCDVVIDLEKHNS